VIAAITTLANRYRVVRPLGGGAMKQVYLAQDTRLADRPCALAEMIDSFANPDAQRQAIVAFTREADILAGFSHEHIVRVYDRFSEANHHYLVMEYVQGKTLEATIHAAGGRLTESAAIDVSLQILDAFEYLHGHNPPIIYRDLKPSNVVVMPNGRVKLIDFGIARLFQPQTRGTLVGTAGYAAPEQYKGMAEPRSDLYALGAAMHFMLTGRDPSNEVPFSFPPLASLMPGVGTALSAVVDEALAQNIGQRIASASEFRRRLERLQSGKTTDPLAIAIEPFALDPHNAQIICSGCGRSIPADASLCPYCGASLIDARASGFDTTAETAKLGGATSPVPKRRKRWPLAVAGVAALAAVAFAATAYYENIYLPRQQALAQAQVRAQQEAQAAAVEQVEQDAERKAAAERQAKLRGQLSETLRSLQSAREGTVRDKELREKAIAIALQMNPPPAVPDDARHEIERGESQLKVAAAPEDYRAAASALGSGLRIAPWLASAYMAMADAEQKAGDYPAAIANLKYYSLANPQASDLAQVQSRIGDMQQLQLKAQQAAEDQRKLALLQKQQEEEAAKQAAEAAAAEAAAQQAAEEQRQAQARADEEAREVEQAREKTERDRYLIVVGEGVGAVKFGITPEQVRAIWGLPSWTYAAGSESLKGWVIGSGIKFQITFSDGEVVSVLCGRPECRTTEGLAVGDPVSKVYQLYGDPQTRRTTNRVPSNFLVTLCYSTGLFITIRNDSVWTMTVNKFPLCQ